MTAAEMLRAEGREEMLMEQLTVKFGSLPGDVAERVHVGTSEQVRTWATRVLTAETLDEVFKP